MRLQVFLSEAGISSRRHAADIIKKGRVQVNGKRILDPSFQVFPEKDRIFFNAKELVSKEKVYIMLNKPKGVTTTRDDPFAKKTVMDLIPAKYNHLKHVGRLDKDTTGLLLLTNDGDLINKLTHPRYNIEKKYTAVLDKRLSDKDKNRLEKGVNLDGRDTAPCIIKITHDNLIDITMHEGRNRQIKRMFSKMGYRVIGLQRTSEGKLHLGGLPEGKWKFLTKEVIDSLSGG